MTPSHHEAHCPGPHGSVRFTARPAHSRPRPPRGAGTSSHQRRPVEHTAGDPRPPALPLAPGGHRTWGGGHGLQGCRPSSRCVPPLTRSPRLSSATHHRMWSRLRHKLHQSRALRCSRPRPGAPRGRPHSPRLPCMARGPVLGAQPSCADPAAAQAATGATQSRTPPVSSRLGSWLSAGWMASSKATQCGPSAQRPGDQRQSHSKPREPRPQHSRLRGAPGRGPATPARLQERTGAWGVGATRAALAEGSSRSPPASRRRWL